MGKIQLRKKKGYWRIPVTHARKYRKPNIRAYNIQNNNNTKDKIVKFTIFDVAEDILDYVIEKYLIIVIILIVITLLVNIK